MDKGTKQALFAHLSSFLTPHRKALFSEVMQMRTRYLTVVLEDIYQSQNASAVLRTCDLTGVQDVHIIEDKNKYTLNPDVALGSSKWLNLNYYNSNKENTLEAYTKLREQGYRIVASSPHKDDYTPDNLPLDKKIAVIFGTELKGLTVSAITNADMYLRIPMYGFTESYNISVSAALILYRLAERIRKAGIDWKLTDDEKLDLSIEWARRSINRSDIIENEFLKSRNTEN